MIETLTLPHEAVTRPTCEAVVGKRAGEWGFEPVSCTQQVGLTQVIGADGAVHQACARFGHRADVVRRIGTALPAVRVKDVDGCVTCQRDPNGPPHEASPRCESGRREHCSCDTCF